nr:hypothetical protein [Deltaproteobacteria bacterium]
MDLIWEVVCLSASIVGLSIRAFTAGFVPAKTSGRTTRKGQRADSLNTEGMYSVMRHPLYTGNFFVGLGFALFFHLWWVSLVYVGAFWLYYERIVFAEEEFLLKQYGDLFSAWAAKTPAFFPRLSLWQPPSQNFSVRTALKREYRTLFIIAAVFTSLELVGDFLIENALILDPFWMAVFLVSGLVWLVLRVLHKKTHMLNVEGR